MMSTSGSMHLPPSDSASSRAHSPGRSTHNRAGSTIKTVVTSPPWARDEPPSPTDQSHHTPFSGSTHSVATPRLSVSRRSHSPGRASQSTSTPHQHYGQDEGPSWWTFTRKGMRDGPPQTRASMRPNWPVLNPKPGGRTRAMKERSLTWLTQRHTSQDSPQDEERQTLDSDNGPHDRWDMHIPMPTPAAAITLSQTRTPGWDSPWSPRSPNNPFLRGPEGGQNGNGPDETDTDMDGAHGDVAAGKSKWYKRRKRLRFFILNHSYVPLLFRLINITFTTAALAMAIRIRELELRYQVLGAVGSSPTLVIIFAPCTLVHVMAAIYLEYFGRPLGLWRTSMKLAHTLSETLFICAWSAALSLCFDNYFTAIIGCAPASSISWYNQISRPIPNIPDLGRGEGGPADTICDDQIALICLVFVGLIMYCTNLFISLFRIFEKVKYHPAAMPR